MIENAIEPHPTSDRAAVARAAGITAAGNILSRVLGLVRDSAIGHYFGTGGLAGAFGIVLRVPLMLYDLLMGGMISAALVPVLSEHADKEQRPELWRIASIFFSLAAAVLAVAVLLIEATAPWIVRLLGGGLEPELQVQAIPLMRLLAPMLLFTGLSGAVTGLLYALKRFAFPAFATAVFNLGIVLTIIALHARLGVAAAAAGYLIGAFLQLLLQLPGLRDARLRPWLNLRHPALRRILILYVPVVFGVAVSMIGTTIDTRLVSGTGSSSVTWMRNATTLIQTTLGLVSVAIGVAVLPSLSRTDAAGDREGYHNMLGLGMRLILTLVIPATVGLAVLSRPIVTLLFQHGEFTPHDTTMVTWALALYLIGLPFAAVDQLLIFAFYARKNTLLPNLVGAYAIGIYLLFALPFVHSWGFFALVIANSAQWTWHTLLMLLLVRRNIGWPAGQRIGTTFVRALVAAAGLGLAAWGAATLAGQLVDTGTLLGRTVVVVAAVALGAAAYAGLAVLLRLEEVHVVWQAVRSRLGRS